MFIFSCIDIQLVTPDVDTTSCQLQLFEKGIHIDNIHFNAVH